MGILDKIKKGEEKKEPQKKPERQLQKEPKKEAKKGKPFFKAHEVLVGPIVTEKSTRLAEDKNQYTFEVKKKANKIDIKKAIENVYGVDVLRVRTINIPRKERRLGATTGWKKGFKKAVVEIKEGQKIDFITA